MCAHAQDFVAEYSSVQPISTAHKQTLFVTCTSGDYVCLHVHSGLS